MDEAEYWKEMEWRISTELANIDDPKYQQYWCDGIQGEAYFINDPRPRILGHAWIHKDCQGGHFEEWRFELLLPHRVKSPEEVDWASLFPAENVTRWLAMDLRRKRLQIEPAAAVPDPP